MSGEAIVSLIGFVLASAAAAAPGSIFRSGAWYRRLNKPTWRPPDWVFAPVWLVLYLTIALAGWLVWRTGELGQAAMALAIYAVQLFLNGLWPAIFFGLRRPGWAVVEIIALLAAIIATMTLFHGINQLAAVLLVPYACWVAFASVLNYRIWRLNP